MEYPTPNKEFPMFKAKPYVEPAVASKGLVFLDFERPCENWEWETGIENWEWTLGIENWEWKMGIEEGQEACPPSKRLSLTHKSLIERCWC